MSGILSSIEKKGKIMIGPSKSMIKARMMQNIKRD